jgi:hypothetical protein
MSAPCTRARPAEAGSKPVQRPWQTLRARLEADDHVSKAVADFAAGKIDFAALNRLLEAAAEQKQEL